MTSTFHLATLESMKARGISAQDERRGERIEFEHAKKVILFTLVRFEGKEVLDAIMQLIIL